MNEAAVNTDKEIWRKIPGDFYSPSIFTTSIGDIGIDVGGHVLVMSIERWHEAGLKILGIDKNKKEKK